MGRRRKAHVNDVVLVGDAYYTIVAVRPNRWGEGYEYGLVSTDAMGRYPAGPVKWALAHQFDLTGRKSRRAGKIYRANIRAGGDTERGCTCQCCPHVKGMDET